MKRIKFVQRFNNILCFSFGTSLLTINNIVKSATRSINTKYDLKDVSIERTMKLFDLLIIIVQIIIQNFSYKIEIKPPCE